MDRGKNDFSNSLENQPNESFPIQPSADTELRIAQNVAAANSVGPMNVDGNVFGTNNMLVENPGNSSICADLLWNMEGNSRSNVQVPRDNNDNSMTGSSLYSSSWIPQMAGSSLDNGGSMASGAYAQGLGGLPTQFHDYALNSEDAVTLSSVFGSNQRPRVDGNTTSNQGNQSTPFRIRQLLQRNAGVGGSSVPGIQVPSQGGIGTDTRQVHGVTSNNEIKFPSLFTSNQRPSVDVNTTSNQGHQSTAFRIRQLLQRNAGFGGSTVPGIQVPSQGGIETDTRQVHGVTSNDEIRFPSLFTSYRIPENERAPTNTRGNRQHIIRRNSGVGASSHVQIARSIGNGFVSDAMQSHNVQNPQINRSSIRIGGLGAAACEPSGRGKPRTSRSHGLTINDSSQTSLPSLCSSLLDEQINRSSLLDEQISRSLFGIDSGLAPRMDVDSQDENMEGNDLGSNAHLLNDIQSIMTARSSSTVGVNIPETEQSQIHEKLMFRSNVEINDSQSNSIDQSNSSICPEQTDNSFLNIGFGGSSTVGLRYAALGSGFSSSNGCPGATQSHINNGQQTDGNFLSLGGNLGDQTLSNNGNAVISGTNAGINSNPYRSIGRNMVNQTWSDYASRVRSVINADANAIISGTNAAVISTQDRSVGGNMGIQTWPNNASRVVSGTNARVMLNPSTSSETGQGNVHQFVARPNKRTLEPGGNEPGIHVNAVPIRGSHGHPGGALRSFNSPAGLHVIEQARASNFPVGSSSLTGAPSGPAAAPLQQTYMNNAMHITANSSTPPLLDGTAARTSQHDQSGLIVPVKDTTAGAAKIISDLSDNSKPAQPDQGTARICGRGKRVPADGVQYAQSAKVLLGPSPSGKPVPVARTVGLAKTSENLIGQTIRTVPNASTTQYAPGVRKIVQPSRIPPTAPGVKKIILPAPPSPTASGSKTKAVYHLKWTDPTEFYKSSGENCCICKRDLTFTATGPVTQPPIPPEVAVLPCGHTFHDECLQRITPEDQLKNPPCIPCAIGNV